MFDLYWLRCEPDPATGAVAPRLLKLKQGLVGGVPRPFPVTLAMARALPSCGVLTTAEFLSIPCRELIPLEGLLITLALPTPTSRSQS